MAIEIRKTKRIFKVTVGGKAIDLSDPNPQMKINEVSDFYAGKYPQLLNSSYERTEKDGDLIITFKTIAGTKG
jgi:PRTRC genetic system protein C